MVLLLPDTTKFAWGPGAEPLVLTDEERDRMIEETLQRAARLHDIEVEIVRNLAERPRSTWCSGCDRMLWAAWRKSAGLPWRPDGGR